VKLWWYETPFARTLAFHFEGERMTVEQQNHVAFGPIERAQFQGRLVQQA
jgi:hypothetical protein